MSSVMVLTFLPISTATAVVAAAADAAMTNINQSINQSWIYIAHKRKASNALVR